VYRVKKEKEKRLKNNIVPNVSSRKRKKKTILLFIYLNKVYIRKLSFTIILFDRIGKNPSLIIYDDLKITTLDKKSII